MSIIKQIAIKTTGVVMLGVFASFFTTNVLCNLAHAIDEMGVEHSHPYGHDHHHGNSSAAAEHEHTDEGHNHDGDSDSGCCNEAVPVFFAALSNTTVPVVGLKIDLPSATVLFTQLMEAPVYHTPVLQETDYLNKAPPLIVADLHILFHSFII